MAEQVLVERLQPIAWLAEQSGRQIDLVELAEHETVAKTKHQTWRVLPTIGCEVEVRFPALCPEEAMQIFQPRTGDSHLTTFDHMVRRLSEADRAKYDALDARLRPRFEATVAAGIPAGKDAYWEFANQPAYAWQTLATELDLLMEDDLIPVGHEHSMHITLGGVATGGGGPAMLLSGMELLYISPERIRAGTQAGGSSWSRRSLNGKSNGLRERPGCDLGLGQAVATELRTLTTARPEEHRENLRTAQLLGAMLLARRLRHVSKDATVQELANHWPDYCARLRELWAARDLPTDDAWGSAHRNPESWQRWADCLERRTDPDSLEAETIGQIRQQLDLAEELIAQL